MNGFLRSVSGLLLLAAVVVGDEDKPRVLGAGGGYAGGGDGKASVEGLARQNAAFSHRHEVYSG